MTRFAASKYLLTLLMMVGGVGLPGISKASPECLKGVFLPTTEVTLRDRPISRFEITT